MFALFLEVTRRLSFASENNVPETSSRDTKVLASFVGLHQVARHWGSFGLCIGCIEPEGFQDFQGLLLMPVKQKDKNLIKLPKQTNTGQ